MTTRAALLGTTAAIGAAVAWTGIASATFLAGTGLWDAFPYPSWQWWQYLPYAAANPTVGFWLKASAAVATAFVAAGALRLGLHQRRSARPLFGNARWATRQEVEKRPQERSGIAFARQPPADGVVLGKRRGLLGWQYVSLVGEEHASLNARTRSGKGVSFVVPNALGWSGSLVCFSVKRDVWEAAAAQRQRLGDAVFIFDLSDPQRRTHRWNPLGYVRRGDPATYSDIARTMAFLLPSVASNANAYWYDAARKISIAIGVLLAETPNVNLNVAAILSIVRRPDYGDALREMIAEARDGGRPYPQSAVETVMSWLAQEGKEGAEGVRETIMTSLALWNDPIVAAATERSDFNLGDLRNRRLSVFVCGGPADVRLFRPVYGLLFEQLVQLNTRVEFGRDPAHRHRVLGLLDEFWALGKADGLADAAAFTASYGFRWAFVQQSKDQSVSAFGEAGARNLFNNTGAELIFGGTDLQTAKEVSERIGTATVAATTTSRPRFFGWAMPAKQNESESQRGQRLLLPEQISRLSRSTVIVLRPGLMPLKLQRIEHFTDPAYASLKGQPPAVQPLQVTVELDQGQP